MNANKINSVRIGIVVARAIVAGDVSYARSLAGSRRAWAVCEARAIIGACRFITRKYGAPDLASSFGL